MRWRRFDCIQKAVRLPCAATTTLGRPLSETDFTEDLKHFNIPTLFIQGDDDQIVPLELSSTRAPKLVENSTLKIYAGAPHGLPKTMANDVNVDILAFIER
jgi:non-heme chloroperoxidase